MPQVTYISLLVGDGDNIAFMRGGRRGWMRDRLAYCQEQVTSASQYSELVKLSYHSYIRLIIRLQVHSFNSNSNKMNVVEKETKSVEKLFCLQFI